MVQDSRLWAYYLIIIIIIIIIIQDANECWTQVVKMLQQKLPAQMTEESADGAAALGGFIDQYFGKPHNNNNISDK